jgi:hypothetical protein
MTYDKGPPDGGWQQWDAWVAHQTAAFVDFEDKL